MWTRPGLSLKTRSLLNLAILSAINRPYEMRSHRRGALNTGMGRVEIREILLHCAACCGAPAALETFKMAQQVLAERTSMGAPGAPREAGSWTG